MLDVMSRRYGVVLVLVVLGVAACSRGTAQPKGEPRFATVVLTDDKESKVSKTSFAPDTPKVYAVFTLADVPSGTTVKSVWIAARTDVAAPNYRLDEASLSMGGSITSGNFSFSRPTSGWPPGEYRVELYIGDRLGHTARFQITKPTSDAATYAFFPYKGLRPEDTVGAILGSRYQPTGNLWFWVGWSDGAPAGSYRFEIRVNGRAASSGAFEVK